jgi:hypothetical protein
MPFRAAHIPKKQRKHHMPARFGGAKPDKSQAWPRAAMNPTNSGQTRPIAQSIASPTRKAAGDDAASGFFDQLLICDQPGAAPWVPVYTA